MRRNSAIGSLPVPPTFTARNRHIQVFTASPEVIKYTNGTTVVSNHRNTDAMTTMSDFGTAGRIEDIFPVK
ncbi:MAG: hypothetical protein KDI78_04695, partial [Xanthomonadales bacterium]|nr:hypothetical protein [Xanthomonadales bacterium]